MLAVDRWEIEFCIVSKVNTLGPQLLFENLGTVAQVWPLCGDKYSNSPNIKTSCNKIMNENFAILQ